VVLYFVNFRCAGRSGPLSEPGPWGFSLTSLMDDPVQVGLHLNRVHFASSC